jgi:putative nucleotidyltransferase with HDIG domain
MYIFGKKMKQNGNDYNIRTTERKTIPERQKILFIEDEQGMRTSYYPGLAWNGRGTAILQTRHGIQEEKEEAHLLSDLCLKEDRFQTVDLRLASLNLTRKIFSVKNILRDICEQHLHTVQENAFASKSYIEGGRAFLHSNLLYLIAATDGNEDTVGHSQLVARYTLLLTRALGIEDREFSVNIERGALLHDIGKIGIPESILRKAGPLTEKEREIIKEHPLLGYEMVEEFKFLYKASRVVLFHHESYDGSGYPYGLSGEEIPLEARIFSIADTLDAITSDRPYRRGQSFWAAFDEIERFKGTQFDPQIADAFLSVPEEKWQQAKYDTGNTFSLHSVH